MEPPKKKQKLTFEPEEAITLIDLPTEILECILQQLPIQLLVRSVRFICQRLRTLVYAYLSTHKGFLLLWNSFPKGYGKTGLLDPCNHFKEKERKEKYVDAERVFAAFCRAILLPPLDKKHIQLGKASYQKEYGQNQSYMVKRYILSVTFTLDSEKMIYLLARSDVFTGYYPVETDEIIPKGEQCFICEKLHSSLKHKD